MDNPVNLHTDLSTLSTRQLGALAEDKAIEYIEHNGGIILKRNYTTPYGEVDIIARWDNIIAFVEVCPWKLFFCT